MKTLMATAAAISLLAGVSVASAQTAPAPNLKGNTTTEQSAAPKAKASSHKTRAYSTMRMNHGRARPPASAGAPARSAADATTRASTSPRVIATRATSPSSTNPVPASTM